MDIKESRIEAAKRATDAAGSCKVLAEKLAEKTGEVVNPWRVEKWRQTGIPAEYVLDVEELTGVSRHDLHPRVFGFKEDAA